MNILIAGGTGQIGEILVRAFQADGHRVTVLSRAAKKTERRVVAWDARTLGAWTDEIETTDVVINLAGRSVNCRYNAKNRREMLASRVDSTRVIGEAIAQAKKSPRVWLQMSTATIYAHRFDAPNDEYAGIIGGDEADAPETWRFSIEAAKAWERAADEAVTPYTRKIKMRTAMVMSSDRGGVFDTLRALVRRGLGGRAASGSQYVSWIHHEDFVNAVYRLIADDKMEGAINLAAPHPITNAEFMREMREACGIPFGLPATKSMLEIGAFLMQTETELVLKSRRVIPQKLLNAGFDFKFETWRKAARDLCRRTGA